MKLEVKKCFKIKLKAVYSICSSVVSIDWLQVVVPLESYIGYQDKNLLSA